jgi:hypothetical protein
MFTAPAISPEAQVKADRAARASEIARDYPELPQTVFALLAENLTDGELEGMIVASDPERDVLMVVALEAEIDARNEEAEDKASAPASTPDHGIEEWWMRPVAKPVAGVAVEDAGIYVLPDGSVVKVKANKDKSRTYALRWTETHQDRLVETGEHKHGEYVYEPGLVALVAEQGRKMTFEEARAHSVLYGQCVRCGRSLKDGKSVEQGMGPVCVRYFQGA